MHMLLHKLTYVVNLPTEGGGGQKLAKSCLRCLWMVPFGRHELLQPLSNPRMVCDTVINLNGARWKNLKRKGIYEKISRV